VEIISGNIDVGLFLRTTQ